jgi:hypothetical protein
MPQFVERPTVIPAAGNRPKLIEEYIGRVNSHRAIVTQAGEREQLESIPQGPAAVIFLVQVRHYRGCIMDPAF